jgi:hypothetical protein
MKISRCFIIFLILLLISTAISFGQEPIEDENWLKGFKTEADYMPTLVYWDFTRLSIKDIPQAKKRLNIIREVAPKTEWEGLYYSNTAIGDSKFVWNAEGGFFRFYFYHTLKYFEFGGVRDFSGLIELDYEKSPFSQKNKNTVFKSKLIKVKIGEKRFLVPELRLKDFCERAVGLSTSLSDFNYYWIKEEDMNKESIGLPILPLEYKKYLRYPVEAEIIHVGKRKVIPNEQSTSEYNFDDIHYPVTINIGTNKKLKEDMNFFVENLGEWIQITKVYQKTAVGFIRRDFDENNQEQCWDSEGGSGQIVVCKEIKVGMTAKTKGDL